MPALANRNLGTWHARAHGYRESRPAAAPSVIGADLIIVGTVLSAGTIVIGGIVEGAIAGRSVTVTPHGHVEGSLAAERISIGGSVVGPVKASVVEIAKTARVVGNITHNSLTIEAGARVEGLRPWRPRPHNN